MRYLAILILQIITLLQVNDGLFCQTSVSDSNKSRFTRFIGEWKLKDHIWKSKFGGEQIDSTRTFIAKAASPSNSIVWNADFGSGSWAVLFWTYHEETGKVNHISNTNDNNIGIGIGEYNDNNDLVVEIDYPHGCTTCQRVYTYHWISPNEFEFNAAIYKEGKLTDDYYGGTFIRKESKNSFENSTKFVQIGVNVSDTTRSLDFYSRLFGMKRVSEWHASKEMAVAAGVNSGRAFDLINLELECDDYVLSYKLNQTQNNLRSKESSENEYYGFEKHGLGYLTFNVENVDPYIELVNKEKIPYKLVTLPNGLRVILLHDPDGTMLEILGD